MRVCTCSGNILIRPHPRDTTRHQVVILDHGLYREMDEVTRVNYSAFLLALITRDDKRAQQASYAMGVKDWYAHHQTSLGSDVGGFHS